MDCARDVSGDSFRNKNATPVSSLLKALKRSMATEYSRELGIKVFEGRTRIAQMGSRFGQPEGRAPFSLRLAPGHFVAGAEGITPDRLVRGILAPQ